MAPVAMAENEVLLDPMHALKASERTLLRKLYRNGPALAASRRGKLVGWMIGGTRYSTAALQRFLDLRIARYWRDPDGVKLNLNYTGRLAAERITEFAAPLVDPPDDD